ncbi:MAG: protein kinase [Chthoniobacter sp.]
MAAHRLALPSGYRLENYLFTATLGKGGFGITYLARDLLLNRVAAVKELLPDSIATRADGATVEAQSPAQEADWIWARDSFLKEAQTVASFRHPNIVNVHRLIEANGTVYMVMDFLDGGSYEERLKRIEREPDENSLRAVIEPLLDGLAEVHKAGLLHRDIKPDNILFNHRGEPVLADFGAAREVVGRSMALTSIVTMGYSPLEQYQSREGLQGAWTDIYALGAVMVRAITGKKPPAAPDRVGKDEYQRLGARPRPGFSAEFLKAVDLALRMKPEDRPQSVAAWRKTLLPPAKPQGPVLLLTAPKGGERWEAGTEQKIRWKSQPVDGKAGVKSVDVELWQGDQLVEKIATGLETAASPVKWKIAPHQPIAPDYLLKLVGRGVDGNSVTTAATEKFSIVPKRAAAPIKTGSEESVFDKLMKFAFSAIFLWLVFLGGWKVVWAKAFPHFPDSTIAWMKEKHPGMVPAGEPKVPILLFPHGSGLAGIKNTPGVTPATLGNWELLAPTNSPHPFNPSLSKFGSSYLRSTPAKLLVSPDLLFPRATPSPSPQHPVRFTSTPSPSGQ